MNNCGTLYIVATPIGNLEDITIRAIKTLLTVNIIACEDTRRTGQLLKYLKDNYCKELEIAINSNQKLISFYDEVEEQRLPQMINYLTNGVNIALVSDSGTPLVSDPGFKIITECIKKSLPVISLPGPTALVSALVCSGLPTNNFLFIGFLPSKFNKKANLLTNLLQCFNQLKQNTTLVFYESPYRLIETLSLMENIFGNKEIVIARELTKLFEEIYRGDISSALRHFTVPKGEFVVMFIINN